MRCKIAASVTNNENRSIYGSCQQKCLNFFVQRMAGLSRHSVPSMSKRQPRVAHQNYLPTIKNPTTLLWCCPFLLCVFLSPPLRLCVNPKPHHSKRSLDFVRIQNNNYDHQFITNSMSWFHLIFGFLIFIVFVTTGKYMRVDFPDKDAIPPELRLLMRSRHIYILFSSLIHLALGVYLTIRPQTWQRVLQYTGSFFLVLSRAFSSGHLSPKRASSPIFPTSAATASTHP